MDWDNIIKDTSVLHISRKVLCHETCQKYCSLSGCKELLLRGKCERMQANRFTDIC